MDTLKVFENPAFGGVRTITDEDGKILFCALDIAHPLGYQRERDAVQRHCRYAVKRGVPHPQNPEKQIEMTFIPEGDVYRLIARSNLPEAQKFESWIFDEVVPSIRKHGAYMTPETLEAALLNPDTLIRLATELKAEREQRLALEAKVAADAPKVRYADAVACAEGGMLVREFAKILKQNGVPDMGEKRLYDDLRRRGLLIKAEGRDKNKPTQYAMERNLFAVREREFSTPLGTFTRTTTLITGRGRQYLLDMYLKERDAASAPVAEGAT